MNTVSNKLPAKSVNILAQRKRRILQDKATVEQRKQNRLKRLKGKKRDFKRAESFITSYLKAEKTANRIKHVVRKDISAKEDSKEKLLLVFRHSGKKIHDESTVKVLNSLRMGNRHDCVLLKNSKENQILLKIVEPFVCFGYPTVGTVRELIFKKGFAFMGGRKIPIQSNKLIEDNLGQHGVICLEDVIHELSSVGEKFDFVVKFLSPFQLGAPRTGWENKVSVSYKRGGEYGNRGKEINTLVANCM